MALSLNTSHPLFGDLKALFCVDDDNTIKDLTGNNTCTPDAAVTVGTGTYGRHFRTLLVSNNAQGIALSPGILSKPLSNPVGTVFVVVNAATSRASRGSVFNIGGSRVNAAVYTGDVVGAMAGTANPSTLGTTDLIGTGAHSFGAAWNGVTGQLSHKVFADGAVQNSAETNLGNASDADRLTYLGGTDAGGYGGLAADYVWVAYFNRFLSDAEIADLHTSIGASNAIALVGSSGVSNAAPTFIGPNIGDQTGTVGVALTPLDVSSKFSDTDALTFSPVGTWPDGVTVSSAGVVSGTPTTDGTYAGLAVRATDTAGQPIDSDTFSFTISAASSGDATADGGMGTSTGSGYSEEATGTGAGTGEFIFDAVENATGSGKLDSVTVNWTWIEGAVGSAVSVTNGSGTITSAGLTATGLPAGSGFGILKDAAGTSLAVQEGTVA